MTQLFMLPITIILLACGVLFTTTALPGSGPLHLIYVAAATLVAAVLYVPSRDRDAPHWLRITLTDTTLVTAIFLVTVLVTQHQQVPTAALLRLTAACFLLVLLATTAAASMRGNAERNRQFTLLAVIGLLATPVWLAPVAEATGNTPWITNAIVASSPFSVFAVALDFDILRTAWFYEHSVLGALRYSYLSWLVYVVIFLALASLVCIRPILKQRKRVRLK